MLALLCSLALAGTHGLRIAAVRHAARPAPRHRAARTVQHATLLDPLIAAPEAPVRPATAEAPWAVHKFGGASLATAELYRTVGDLLVAEATGGASGTPTMAIVSAMGGMTDLLIKVVDSALEDFDRATVDLESAVSRQLETLRELAPPEITAPIEANIRNDAADVLSVVRSLRMIKTVPAVTMEVVTGFGEIWSAQTLYAYLKARGHATQWLDAREVLVVRSASEGLGEKGSTSTTGVAPLWGPTKDKMREWWAREGAGFDRLDFEKGESCVVVATGFVATNEDGVPTTLKRSGSDYSATIFARLLGASRATMWKNTDGVYTADPRRVPEAFPIASLKYDEAMELAYFGAQVLHPSAMAPCIDDNIPVYVRNVFNPEFEGTVIRGRSGALTTSSLWGGGAQVPDDEPPIKGITSVDDAALVTLEAATLGGAAAGVGERVLKALAERQIALLMVTQASSEASITVAVPGGQADDALAAIEGAFELEFSRAGASSATLLRDMSVVAIVGEGMVRSPGTSATFMSALARAGVNIGMIAQGSSERQIAVAVKKEEATRALRAAHSAFTLSETVTHVALLGATGRIGTELLPQLKEQQASLKQATHLRDASDIRVVAATSSKSMLLAEPYLQKNGLLGGEDDAFDVAELHRDLERAEPLDLEKLSAFVESDANPRRVVIDATGSAEVAAYYERWLEAGVSIVSPSKSVAAGPLGAYDACFAAARASKAAKWRYESSVGASLPILGTLKDILLTGDRVRRVSGCLSGTLGYALRGQVLGGTPFSASLREAVELGYAEPDVRDDLSGLDMAQKVLVLARDLGLRVELADVKIESLLPEALAAKRYDGDVSAQFLDDLAASDFDETMNARLGKALSHQSVLRYAFTIDVDAGTVEVGLAEVNNLDPKFRLKKNENLVAFVTDRYDTAPLIIKGAAAGAELAAAGIFADLLRLEKSA